MDGPTPVSNPQHSLNPVHEKKNMKLRGGERLGLERAREGVWDECVGVYEIVKELIKI